MEATPGLYTQYVSPDPHVQFHGHWYCPPPETYTVLAISVSEPEHPSESPNAEVSLYKVLEPDPTHPGTSMYWLSAETEMAAAIATKTVSVSANPRTVRMGCSPF